MLESFSPEESFRFAAKLRTGLNDEKIEEKVNEVINRLGLQDCRKTQIGGNTFKGISGGERKRTCIGYEMFTDPKVLLCDEPTSCLDSTTALRIIEMLKKEAKENNMTIICTIHQPSSEIFNCFDNLLLLQDGHQIYQGPVKEVNNYLRNNLACELKKY